MPEKQICKNCGKTKEKHHKMGENKEFCSPDSTWDVFEPEEKVNEDV